jgi:hypothetical protein
MTIGNKPCEAIAECSRSIFERGLTAGGSGTIELKAAFKLER